MGPARRAGAPVVALALVALSGGGAVAQDATVAVSDHVVESFDGTLLAVTLLLPGGASAGNPVPLVLRTHGWGGSRETGSDTPGRGIDPQGATLQRLLDEGYAVLTWDQRGFGCSGGEARLDDPDVEGRDVTALLDWAVEHAPVVTDTGGDPVVGMTGGSYAGGIQMAAAATDPRIDAIAPEISWSDLRYSLYSGDVVNQGWVGLLYGLGAGTGTLLGLDPACGSGPAAGSLDPAIHAAVTEFLTTGRVSDDTRAFLAGSSLAGYGPRRPVRVPTLVLQGSVDTLFDLTDGYGVYEHVRDQGVAARFVAFCGGHVACPASYADAGDRAYLDDAIVAWFARHLRGEDVDTGAAVSYRTNEGVWRDADTFEAGRTVAVEASAASLPVVPVVDVPDRDDLLALVAAGPPAGLPALPFTAAHVAEPEDPRSASFEVARAMGGPLEVRGIPEVELTVSGTTVSLADALAPLGDLAAALPSRTVGDVLVGSLGPLGTLAGGIVSGTGGGGPLGGADGTVNVFVKLVHREAGEVLNLQEGALRVDLARGRVRAPVPMPGLAYTLPEGDHLDLEVSTASLLHATGRTPALIDVAVAGRVPVGQPVDADGASARDDDGAPAARAAPTPPAATLEPLPATGGGVAPAAVGLALLLLAGVLRALAARPRGGGRRRFRRERR